jgi:hypothetical protein
MTTKKELKWLAGFALVSILIIGLMTEFKFKYVEIQQYDTYYVFNPITSILYLTGILWMVKNMYLTVDFLTTQYKIIALFVSIINPLLGLFIVLLMYLNFNGQLIPANILVGIFALQIILEIRMLKKVGGFFRNSRRNS